MVRELIQSLGSWAITDSREKKKYKLYPLVILIAVHLGAGKTTIADELYQCKAALIWMVLNH